MIQVGAPVFAARNAAVAADGELQGHRRTAFGHSQNMAQRHLTGFVVQHALGHLDAGGAHPCEPVTGSAGISIAHGYHHARRTCGGNGIGAGGAPALEAQGSRVT